MPWHTPSSRRGGLRPATSRSASAVAIEHIVGVRSVINRRNIYEVRDIAVDRGAVNLPKSRLIMPVRTPAVVQQRRGMATRETSGCRSTSE